MYGRTEVSLRYYGPWGETIFLASNLWFQLFSKKGNRILIVRY
jgi:hypothetical protein